MKLKVNVNLFDLHEGTQKQCGKCPVALAIHRALRHAFNPDGRRKLILYVAVYSDIWTITVWKPRDPGSMNFLNEIFLARFNGTHDKKAFIRAFDSGGRMAVHPTSFTIDLDNKVVAYLREAA